MILKTSEHTNIHIGHPRSLIKLEEIVSKEQPIKIVPKPTKRFLKKMELDYQYCPDCESQNIIFSGKASSGKQRFKCKACNYQFVSQFDSIFPRSKRQVIFEEEFLSHLKPTGLDRVGSGNKIYWLGARVETLHMIESHALKVRFGKLLKIMPICTQKEYKVILEFTVSEAYRLATM